MRPGCPEGGSNFQQAGQITPEIDESPPSWVLTMETMGPVSVATKVRSSWCISERQQEIRSRRSDWMEDGSSLCFECWPLGVDNPSQKRVGPGYHVKADNTWFQRSRGCCKESNPWRDMQQSLRAPGIFRDAMNHASLSSHTLYNLYIYNPNIFLRLLLINPRIFNLMYDVEALYSSSKDRMFTIQPWRLLRRNEELWTIRVRSSVSHADRVWLVMFESWKLVFEFAAPDTFTTGAVTKRIAALWERFSMEARAGGPGLSMSGGQGDLPGSWIFEWPGGR